MFYRLMEPKNMLSKIHNFFKKYSIQFSFHILSITNLLVYLYPTDDSMQLCTVVSIISNLAL